MLSYSWIVFPILPSVTLIANSMPQGATQAFARADPLIIAGLHLSREDDLENDQPIMKWFERHYFSAVQSADCQHDENGLQCANIKGGFDERKWQDLVAHMWNFVDHATTNPSMAHAMAMVLYSWFWWEGPRNTRVNVVTGRLACDFFASSLDFSGCMDPALPLHTFYVRNCHMRWRYLMMISSELGRHLAAEVRDLKGAMEVMQASTRYFNVMRQMPAFGPHAGPLQIPHDISLNADYFPASVVKQGPVWKNPSRDVPMASFLEANFETIRSELLAILAEGNTFSLLNQATRSAEPQFGPRDDDWLTAYLVRNAQFSELICEYAPRTCALLRTRPELAECHSSLSGAGFLRMRPGGRLKPHFGGAPRLSAHLALVVPDGELYMSVGRENVRWVEGQVIVFDDTYIHSVTHNGVDPRYVLNIWMCHPCDPTNGHGSGFGEQLPEFCEGPEQGILPPETYRNR
eukprot:TRINITY_DN39610_c0_g1_i1.p1 TRINITY_DN39610_c0_g1~~TRINITY_DN39610_c0_g1_i1.p1  ORF type:complete len:462 (-),score=35.59 TRINITY_DN39610_c0_g1_i1:205-1590(-)